MPATLAYLTHASTTRTSARAAERGGPLPPRRPSRPACRTRSPCRCPRSPWPGRNRWCASFAGRSRSLAGRGIQAVGCRAVRRRFTREIHRSATGIAGESGCLAEGEGGDEQSVSPSGQGSWKVALTGRYAASARGGGASRPVVDCLLVAGDQFTINGSMISPSFSIRW